jgi:hypothetical protein
MGGKTLRAERISDRSALCSLKAIKFFLPADCLLLIDKLVAHTGLEPVISALRGQRVNQLHQCAVVKIDYRYPAIAFASWR